MKDNEEYPKWLLAAYALWKQEVKFAKIAAIVQRDIRQVIFKLKRYFPETRGARVRGRPFKYKFTEEQKKYIIDCRLKKTKTYRELREEFNLPNEQIIQRVLAEAGIIKDPLWKRKERNARNNNN